MDIFLGNLLQSKIFNGRLVVDENVVVDEINNLVKYIRYDENKSDFGLVRCLKLTLICE